MNKHYAVLLQIYHPFNLPISRHRELNDLFHNQLIGIEGLKETDRIAKFGTTRLVFSESPALQELLRIWEEFSVNMDILVFSVDSESPLTPIRPRVLLNIVPDAERSSHLWSETSGESVDRFAQSVLSNNPTTQQLEYVIFTSEDPETAAVHADLVALFNKAST